MFCIKIKNQLRALLRHFDSYIDAHIETALAVTAGLKRILSSPVADVLNEIIPGHLDDVIRQKITEGLNIAVEALGIVDSCKQYADVNQKLTCFLQQLDARDPMLQDAVLQKIASILSAHLDGSRLKQNLYDLYTQAKYAAKK